MSLYKKIVNDNFYGKADDNTVYNCYMYKLFTFLYEITFVIIFKYFKHSFVHKILYMKLIWNYISSIYKYIILLNYYTLYPRKTNDIVLYNECQYECLQVKCSE